MKIRFAAIFVALGVATAEAHAQNLSCCTQGQFTVNPNLLPVHNGRVTAFGSFDVTLDGAPDFLAGTILNAQDLFFATLGAGNYVDAGTLLPLASQSSSISEVDSTLLGGFDLVYLSTFGQDLLYVDVNQVSLIDATSFLPPKVKLSNDSAWGDVNGDGMPDIVVVHAVAGGASLYIWENNSWKDKSFQLPAPNNTLVGVAMADVEGDGDLDILIGNSSFANALLFVNNGSGQFTDVTATQMPPLTSASYDPEAVDMNLDGWVDFYCGSNGGGGDYILVNQGSFGQPGVFTRHQLGSFVDTQYGTQFLTSAWVDVEDINMDGLPDVLVSHPLTQLGGAPLRRSYLLVQKPSDILPTPLKFDVHLMPLGPKSSLPLSISGGVELTDADGDGKLDAIIGAYTPGPNGGLDTLIGNY